MTLAERIRLRDKIDLAVKMATTYLRKSTDALYWTTDRPIPAGYWTLLDQALVTAADIVGELPDDFFEDEDDGFNMSDEALEQADKVVAALRARRERTVTLRRIRALENTTGRTEEEAAAFRAKAAELRGRLS